jgi:quinohemoprotein ethanol dehydrogenase
MRCHGTSVTASGAIRDLRYMTDASHKLFDDIVRKGLFSSLGMVSFADVLTEKDASDIHNYIISVANDKWDDDHSSTWWIETRLWFYDTLGVLAAWLI